VKLGPLQSIPADDDGWVKMPGGELLFWVPPDNRSGLLRPPTLKVLEQQRPG